MVRPQVGPARRPLRLRDGKGAVLQLVHEIEKLPGGARVGPVLLDPVPLAELLDLVAALDGGLGRVVVAAVGGNGDDDLLPLVGLERALLEGVPFLLLWRRPILSKEMYAKKACELVKEFSSSESGQLSAFNSDVFAQVIEECNTHFSQLQSLLSSRHGCYGLVPILNPPAQEGACATPISISDVADQEQSLEEGLDNQTARNADHFGALIHHLSLVRNKRCLMAYVYNRAEVIRSLGWIKEAPLPEEIQEKLGSSEKDYSQNHSATIRSYQLEMDIDLAVDMVPPKDPYIKVRVLEDIGSVALSDQIANLARHAILFLRRTDAETYISQVVYFFKFASIHSQQVYRSPDKINIGHDEQGLMEELTD
ncbi:hypothetical protein RHGRI_024889 [Rhododendron griersonianum]|uniref:Uncharacterized protein n=1 Tax=Rhododendron griersonianum TaxID=479676 RepID=A0AAV6J8S4_9ERIC|nr:hypothetical protein RHGRI_024889 [Rhododendron griersonianum]